MSTIISRIICGGSEETRTVFLKNCLTELKSSIDLENHPDIVSVKEEDSSIGVDAVREFQAEITIKPALQKIKIGIIYRSDLLTLQAQNSLLKTLEEPPQNSAIFLLCQNEDKLIRTVISRCETHILPQVFSAFESLDFAAMESEFKLISSSALSEKLTLAAQISKDRDNAIDWLNQMLIFVHQSAFSNLTNWPNLTNLFNIFEAKKRLNANTNVRLTMENLLINW